MKTPLLLTCLFFCGIINAQTWFQQTSGTDSTLMDVYFVDPNIGLACGSGGTILKTTNGGTNWSALSPGVSDLLQVIRFLNADTGFVCGAQNGLLLKTTDGGATWNNIGPNMPGQYNGGMWFTGVDTGFLAIGDSPWSGSIRKILKTTNSGTSWDTVYSGPNWINYFYFVNSDIGYVTTAYSCQSCGDGLVLKTIDGGNNWSVADSFGHYWMSANYFINKDTGFAGGGNCISFPDTAAGKIWKTTNGGASWQMVLSDNRGTGNKIFFTGPNTGYTFSNGDCTGASDSILKTTDGGITWASELTMKNNFRGFFFIGSQGYAVGDSGGIIKYGTMQSVKNAERERIDIVVYPNPSSQGTSLRFNNLMKGNYTLLVYNVYGQQVEVITRITTDRVEIEKNNFMKGLYFLQLMRDNQVVATGKLVID